MQEFINKEFHHKELFTSKHRNNWFYKQIKQACPGKVCMDIGAGSGILSLFAIHAGAKHVYMVEHNPNCCNMIEKIFKSAKIPPEKYTLIKDQANKDFIFTDKVDVIISETVSSNLFSKGYPGICRVIQNIKALKDAIVIPDKLYGSLVFFEDYSILDEINKYYTPEIITTGVKEIDDVYTFTSDMVEEVKPNLSARIWRTVDDYYDINQSHLNQHRNLWEKVKETKCHAISDVITFDAYNLNNKFEWRTLCMIPNKTYGIMLIGTLGCERTNSTKHIMNLDVWGTYFYKFTKMSDILNIKFKEGNFEFRSI